MPARRRVSGRQMELLVDFAESHRDVALGRFPGGPQAVRVIRKVWDSVALQLNSVADGTTKTPDQWRRYWIEFKAKTKAKAADSRRNASATGGGPNKLIPLNEIEMRVLSIIGRVAVEGLPGVRVPVNISIDETVDSGIAAPVPDISFPSTSTTEPESFAPNPSSSEPLMEVEWLEEDIPSPLELQPEFRTSYSAQPPPSIETTPADANTPDIPTQPDVQHEVLSREGGDARRTPAPVRRLRPQRQIRRDENVPRWAYDIEMRRIVAEERHMAAMEALEMRRIVAEERHTAALETMVALLTQMRDDVHSYAHGTG